jgi:amino acid transporter, AAT family
MIQKTDSSSLKWKTPFYPYSQYLAVILMLAIFVGEFFTHDGREILLSGCIWFIFASVYMGW